MKKITKLIKKQPKLWLVVFLSIALLLLAALILLLYSNPFLKEEVAVSDEEQKEDIIEEFGFRRLLDGVRVEAEEEINPVIYAIQVENMIDSRPLAGISKANLVYETLVEAGITRFLALFLEGNEVEIIGPVRSARPYYIDWTEEYGALYAHSGGSPEALQTISKYDIVNFDEFANGPYFWRDKGRYAPHNLYTSTELLGSGFEYREGEKREELSSWQFKNEATKEERPGEEKRIEIDFSTFAYMAGWQYGREENSYTRYQARKEQKDEDGSTVIAKNIAVQFTDIIILDEVGRKRIKTIGEGEAIIFQDGIRIDGEWKKEKRGERTRFYSENGEEIKFNPGVTWIEVVPIGTEVTFE